MSKDEVPILLGFLAVPPPETGNSLLIIPLPGIDMSFVPLGQVPENIVTLAVEMSDANHGTIIGAIVRGLS